jgi:hypothetical protein
MENIANAQLTPGKADDALARAECLFREMAETAKHIRENYVTEEGSFEQIRFVEIGKWLPILEYASSRVQHIGTACFGANMEPEVRNQLLNLLLNVIGIKTTSTQVGFLSGLLNPIKQ